jgi:hypothetical protein
MFKILKETIATPVFSRVSCIPKPLGFGSWSQAGLRHDLGSIFSLEARKKD